jgi:hypothetical protein
MSLGGLCAIAADVVVRATRTMAPVQATTFRKAASHLRTGAILNSRPGREFQADMATWGVNIGRTWPGFENWPRISVGTEAEMARFRDAFASVSAGKLGPVTPPKRRTASLDATGSLLRRASFGIETGQMPILTSC